MRIWLRSHLNSVWGNVNWMCIEPIHLWRWISTELLEPSFNWIHCLFFKITHSYTQRTAALLKLLCLGHHTVFAVKDMNYGSLSCWDATDYMLLKMKPLTKWSRLVCLNLHYTSSTTSDKVRQIIGQTLVCVSIHLECWLDKARVKLLLVLQWVWHANSNLVTIWF